MKAVWNVILLFLIAYFYEIINKLDILPVLYSMCLYCGELLYFLIGLGKNTRCRKLYDGGMDYVATDLTNESCDDGYATVEIPFNYLPNFITGPIKYLTIVTDPILARQIGNYGNVTSTNSNNNNNDKNVRIPFHMTRILIGCENLVSRNDENVISDRGGIKRILHDTDRVKSIINEEFNKWINTNTSNTNTSNTTEHNKTIDIEMSIKKTMYTMLGRILLGVNVFPPDNEEIFSLSGMINLIDKLDKAMTLFDMDTIKKLSPEMMVYSNWLYQYNKETMLDVNNNNNNTIIPYMIDVSNHNINNNNNKINYATLLLVTPNLTKLIYLSIIYFMIHPEWQEIVRESFVHSNNNNNDNKNLKHIYMELTRLFIPSTVPRYASKITTFETKKGPVTFQPGTLFYVLGRHIRMNPDFFPDPQTFDPSRYEENKIKMNDKYLFPFGLGPRQCPASGSFTELCWMEIMKIIFTQTSIESINNTELEEIPINVRHISLKNRYLAHVNKLVDSC